MRYNRFISFCDNNVDFSKALPAQKQEIASLTEFARERGFGDDILRVWDVAYWSRKQRRSLYK